MTRSSARISAGVPAAITRPELEHDDLVADAEHQAHVVVDQQHGRRRRRPAPRMRGRGPGSRRVSRPAAGSSRQQQLRAGRRAPGPRRPACADPATARPGTATRPSVAEAPIGSAGPSVDRRRHRRLAATDRGSRPRSGRRTARATATCGPARPAPAGAARRPSSGRPANCTVPVGGHEPGERVDQRRLARRRWAR